MSDDDFEDFDDDISEELDDSEEEDDDNEIDDNEDKNFDIEDVTVSNLSINEKINVNEMEKLLNDKENKKTTDKITKYEYTKIIGLRATQISRGMPALIDTQELDDPYLIAVKEYQENLIPFIIKRPLPDGESFEYWRLEDLRKNNNTL